MSSLRWLSPRAFGWPSPAAAGRVRFFRLTVFLAVALGIDLVARLIARRLVAWQLAIPVTFRPRDALLLTLIPLIRLALAPAIGLETLQQSRQPGVKPDRWAGFLSDRELIVWLLLFLPFVITRYVVAMGSAYPESGLESYLDVFLIWGWTAMFVQASKRTQRLRALERAILRRPLRTLNRTRVLG